MAQFRQEMRDKAYVGEYDGVWMAHETDDPLRDAFPSEVGEWAFGRMLYRLGIDNSSRV